MAVQVHSFFLILLRIIFYSPRKIAREMKHPIHSNGATAPDWHHIDNFLFDLDQTLYHPSVNLFEQVRWRMTDYITKHFGVTEEEASKIRDDCFQQFGTTLSGLVNLYDVDPDDFLSRVHQIDYSPLEVNAEMRDVLSLMEVRCFVFTNGTADHAERTLASLGLSNTMEDICDIRATSFVPKPRMEAYHVACARFGIDPTRTAMFEDMEINLEPAAKLGMRTVLVNAPEGSGAGLDHVTEETTDLTQFLKERVLSAREGANKER